VNLRTYAQTASPYATAQPLIRLMITIMFGSFSILAWPLLGNVVRSGMNWSGSFAAILLPLG
jgi:hypothetical protein